MDVLRNASTLPPPAQAPTPCGSGPGHATSTLGLVTLAVPTTAFRCQVPDSRNPDASAGQASPEKAALPGELSAHGVEAAIDSLESEMQHLQARHRDLFALANAWAERHDAILAATPPQLRAAAELRLQRIGIRWGVVDGVRLTREFRALHGI